MLVMLLPCKKVRKSKYIFTTKRLVLSHVHKDRISVLRVFFNLFPRGHFLAVAFQIKCFCAGKTKFILDVIFQKTDSESVGYFDNLGISIAHNSELDFGVVK